MVWIHDLFRGLIMNSQSFSRIHYESLSISRKYYEFTMNLQKQWILYMYREFTMNSLYISRIYYELSIFLRILRIIHYL